MLEISSEIRRFPCFSRAPPNFSAMGKMREDKSGGEGMEGWETEVIGAVRSV